MTQSPSVIHSFPKAFDAAAANVLSLIREDVSAVAHGCIELKVGGEQIAFPRRVYLEESQFEGFHGAEKPFAQCLLTRHHNGFVRARALDQIIGLNHAWSIPYVILLIGEYVVELLDQIDARFDLIDRDLIAAFFRENPTVLSLTQARVMSYWSCYYRRRSDRDSYVGFRLIRRIEEAKLAASR